MRAALIALALAITTTTTASAQNNRDLVIQQMEASQAYAESQGLQNVALRSGGPMIGSLGQSGRVELEIALESGRDYFIAAFCDYGCDDIDLALLDKEMDVLDSDYLTDDTPVLTVTASHDGPHMLRVDMASCQTTSCLFGVVMFESRD
jgi:hypothetical protein